MQLEDKEVKLEMEKWEIEQRSAKKKKKQHSSKVVDVDAVRQMTKSKLMWPPVCFLIYVVLFLVQLST